MVWEMPMTTTTLPAPSSSVTETVADIARRLGDIPLSRIITDPPPGTATEADLLRLIEVDQRPCEWIEGTLVEKAVGFDEGLVSSNLIRVMGEFVHARRLGAVTPGDACLRMASGNARAPDVTYISKADLPPGPRPRGAVPKLPPTIAVEVLSPGNTTAEMRIKTREFFASGARLVWRIDRRARTVAVFHEPTDDPATLLTDADQLDGGSALPGFTMPVADLFVDPLVD
jgi:Uma2 family endonuclease